MHLTNYSVNKHSGSFDGDEREDKGSKRTLRYFIGWLRTNGHNVVELWTKIHVSIIPLLAVMTLSYDPSLIHTGCCHKDNNSSSPSSPSFMCCVLPRSRSE